MSPYNLFTLIAIVCQKLKHEQGYCKVQLDVAPAIRTQSPRTFNIQGSRFQNITIVTHSYNSKDAINLEKSMICLDLICKVVLICLI